MRILTVTGEICDVIECADPDFFTKTGIYTQDFVISCTEHEKLPLNYIFRYYPHVFDVIATENTLDPNEWLLTNEKKYYAPRIYKNSSACLKAVVNSYGWIIEFIDTIIDRTMRYSVQYDAFFESRVFHDNQWHLTQPSMAQKRAIQKIYKEALYESNTPLYRRSD